MASQHHVYVHCPVCRTRIAEPFARRSGPVPYIHRTTRHGRRVSCRLIVTPDPTGHGHSVREVPRSTTLEAALAEAIEGVAA